MDIGKDIRETVMKYSDMLYKICIVILCNEQDVQDAVQDTFCRYLEKKPEFCDEEHEKAWLIRVATNICRDMNDVSFGDPDSHAVYGYVIDAADGSILEAYQIEFTPGDVYSGNVVYYEH